jgi:flagellar motor switch protein FliM
MTTASDNITNNLIKKLLKSAGEKPAQQTNLDTAEYDWNQCRYFNKLQMNKIDAFAQQSAKSIAEKLSTSFNTNCNASVENAAQIYASQCNQHCNSSEKDYNLIFNKNENDFAGLITLPHLSAAALVALLLDDTESENLDEKKLSGLEETFLSDIAENFVTAIRNYHPNCNFTSKAKISNDPLFLDISAGEPMTCITLKIQKENQTQHITAHILIRCRQLHDIAEKQQQNIKPASPQDIEKAVLNSIANVNLQADVKLDSIKLTFKQIMTLEPDDVIVLNKKVSQGADIIIQNQTMFNAQLAKKEGSKAVVITKPVIKKSKKIKPIPKSRQIGETANA